MLVKYINIGERNVETKKQAENERNKEIEINKKERMIRGRRKKD